MSLSKQQMLGAVGAGVFVLAAGGLGFMLYSTWSALGEKEEELQGATDTFNRYYSAAVFPSKASIDAVKANGVSYTNWYAAAAALAARGDKTFPEETPPIFKQRLQAEVQRMAALEGGADGRIAAPTFLFGFDRYLGENGTLPAAADVPHLSIQLDTIARVVDVCAEAGILELKSIKRLDEKRADDEEEEAANGKNKKKGASEKDENGPKETVLNYAFEFTTRPAALVSVLNRLTSCARFVTVKNLSFRETADMIVDRLKEKENAEQQKASGRTTAGRRGRRTTEQSSAAAATVQIDPLVVDPEMDAPILVNFNLEVRDFGHAAAAAAAAEQPAEEKPAEEKPAETKPAETKGGQS